MQEEAHNTKICIAQLIQQAKAAMCVYENHIQQRVDDAVTAIAWSVYKPEHAKQLAQLAVEDTGLGNVESKIIKNTRKTFGTVRDLLRVKTVGIIENIPEKGLIKYGKPVGVVAAVCPSTNPAATPVNKAMMALKGGNAVIIAPSPSGYKTTQKTVSLMREALKKTQHPVDLIQILPNPVSKELTEELIKQSDLAVVTGSQNNVKRAMQSGTVAIGVGAGNVPVIIDSDADLCDAAKKITQSKIFDNATSCSSENALVILEDVYEQAIEALVKEGGYRCNAEEKDVIHRNLWHDNHLNRNIIAKDIDVLVSEFQFNTPSCTKYFIVEEDAVKGLNSFADEKLSLVLTVYKARNFDHAQNICREILDVKGKGHSIGIHTQNYEHAQKLAQDSDVVRVLVNQAHTFGNGGSFSNSLPFTLSMGCGTWANNTISENLNWLHFINITHLVSEIPEDKPTEEEIFGDFWKKYGQ